MVTADSRQVTPGATFVAIAGHTSDGRDFIAQAVANGAATIIAQPDTIWPENVPRRPLILDPEPRRALARLAAEHAGPAPDTVVAVTGTNGKTSTVDFLRQIWENAGLPAASLGTLGLLAPGRTPTPGLTTPNPVALAQTLAQLRTEGVNHLALEASSHGLDQFRLDGVRIAVAAFTNLTRDHLDYHGSEAAYRAAKLRLFAELLPKGAVAIVNADMDPETLAALRNIARTRGLHLHTVGEAGETLKLIAATPRPDGQTLDIEADGQRHSIELALPGRFQADNALLAAALARATGVPDALTHLPHLRGVRGRMELAARLPNGAAAYVDYAHTPDALTRLLGALRPHAVRLVCVFGAGGDRDAGKRPLMGAAVAAGADMAIVTDDNPRTEPAAAIRAAILAAVPGAREIADRRAAIAAGLDELRPGDVLVVAGKGHEQGQIVGANTYPFDDVTCIRELAA